MSDVRTLLKKRPLLFDGGMGTYYKGAPGRECEQANRLDPEGIWAVHRAYLAAGADAIKTNTFGLPRMAAAQDPEWEALADAGWKLAAEAAAGTDAAVFADLGPAPDTEGLSAAQVYTAVVRRFAALGAKNYLFETLSSDIGVLDAVRALRETVPDAFVQVSFAVLPDGYTREGQHCRALVRRMADSGLVDAVGLNCVSAPGAMRTLVQQLGQVGIPLSVMPNAGYPVVTRTQVQYRGKPDYFASELARLAAAGVRILGGCCGTTPAHIFELSKIVGNYAPRPLPEARHETVLSGLEPLRIVPEANFINIGERTNVAGSARFARLIREGSYEEALSVARAQVEAGAQIVDVCMDDGLIDGPAAMRTFLNLMASEPEIARVPTMIDSSKWEVLEAGLEVTQGKAVVNSISLKEGEAEFLRRAAAIRRYGAAAVVMLFDERGQADTFERKIEVAERAYRLLTGNGFPPEEIIFDPNVLAVATGIPEHDGYAKAFIDATRWIKEHLPHAKVSGGVSNLSFAFRGNNAVREAMHSAFLYHAIRAGMDMGIVNPQMLRVYDQIEPELLERVEDVLLCRRPDASERLAEYAHAIREEAAAAPAQAPDAWRTGTLAERIDHAMLKGIADCIEEDALEGYRTLGSPMEVIDRLLMPAMERVGRLFGEGRMFLPQVVKTARVMKRAVAALTPYIEQGTGQSAHTAGKVLIATVKGDVHDIGKNIVSVVMACNGYEIRDLGVMVEPQRIVDEAVAWGAQCICLSGLITPSLDEMIHVCEELERRRLRIPVIIGGATTSELHTAVKIAPVYSGAVVHSPNASRNAQILARLLGPDGESYTTEVRAAQEELRRQFEKEELSRRLIPIVEVRKARKGAPHHTPVVPLHPGRMVFPDFDVADVEPYIDWNFFFPAWGLKGRYPDILDHPERGAEARKLFDDAQAMLARIRDGRLLTLQAAVGIFPARSEGDDIWVADSRGRERRFAMLRNQTRGEENRSLADFIAPAGDWIGCFAVTAGIGLRELEERFRSEGDDYSAIMAKLLADRLTEAFAEVVHSFVRRQMWGYEQGEPPAPAAVIRGDYRGRRMAFGYPASPDHSLKREAFDLLAAEITTGMRLTENWMIDPGEALCGLMFADAEYFSVGKIDTKQLLDYARRRGMEVEQVKKLIPNNI